MSSIELQIIFNLPFFQYEKISKKSSQNQSLDNSQTFVQQTNMIQELLKENEKLKEKINYLENKMRELITTRINELKNSK